MTYLMLVMLLSVGLLACKTQGPINPPAESTLPEGWVKDPFRECAPEDQVEALFASMDWELDKVEGDIEPLQMEWHLDIILYADLEITPIMRSVCYTLETYPNKNDNDLVEVSSEQIFYLINRTKYFVYHFIRSDKLVDLVGSSAYLYFTGKPRD